MARETKTLRMKLLEVQLLNLMEVCLISYVRRENKMSMKLVSIVIPTYSRPVTLERAINSVLNQTYPYIEIIVVDDNNPNTPERAETEEVMEGYSKNETIKYIQHEFNKNGSAARNTGYRHSNGNYLMFLDDDDEFLPNKIELQLNCLESRDESWGACYTKYKRLINGKLESISAENIEGNIYFEELCRNLFISAGSNLMIRREAFEEIHGFDESFLRNQDIEFLVRLAKKYKVAFVDEFGLLKHGHAESRDFDLSKITEHYLNSFSNHIDELSEKQRGIFYKHINLQLFRYWIINRKNLKAGLSMIKKSEVNIIDAIRYFTHLVYRRISKKSYGFKVG